MQITTALLKPILLNGPFICLLTIMGATIPLISLFQSNETLIKELFWRCSISSLTRSFSIAYLLALLIEVKWLTWLKWPIVIMASIIGIALCFSYLRYHLPLSPALFSILANTSPHEIRSFLSTVPLWVFITAPIIVTVWLCIYYVIDHKTKVKPSVIVRHHLLATVCTLTVLTFVGGGLWKFKEVFQAWKFSDKAQLEDWNYNRLFSWNLPRDIYSAIGLLSAEINTESRNIATQRLLDTKIIANNTLPLKDSLDVVFVIGESYQPWHASIYDYPLPTTPRMSSEQQKGNLIVFEDAASVFNCTPDAIFNMLTLNRVANDEPYEEYSFFPQLFSNAGWETFFCEHQFTPKSIFDNSIYEFVNNQISQNFGWTKYIESHNEPYDAENLFADWNTINSIPRDTPHRFTIYHLKGQHFDYVDKYPATPQFNRFHPADYNWRTEKWLDTKRKQIIAHYDNATLYNDYCMGLLFKRYGDSNAIIVYCSDHAEEIYDYRDFYHREFYNIANLEGWIDHEIRVPLVIWMSDTFMQKYPEHKLAIKDATDKVISIDDIGHFLLSVSGIKTPAYNPHHDFTSPLYVTPSRKTINNVPIKPRRESSI